MFIICHIKHHSYHQQVQRNILCSYYVVVILHKNYFNIHIFPVSANCQLHTQWIILVMISSQKFLSLSCWYCCWRKMTKNMGRVRGGLSSEFHENQRTGSKSFGWREAYDTTSLNFLYKCKCYWRTCTKSCLLSQIKIPSLGRHDTSKGIPK